jgi:hypothetical protein
MASIVLIIIVGTTIWVGVDSSRLGAARGTLGGGSLDMGTASWVLVCLLLWIVGFPCYLAARPRLIAAKAAREAALNALAVPPAWGAPPNLGSNLPWQAVPATAPDQVITANPMGAPASPAAEVERLHSLHRSGAISVEEYEALKQRVLRQ